MKNGFTDKYVKKLTLIDVHTGMGSYDTDSLIPLSDYSNHKQLYSDMLDGKISEGSRLVDIDKFGFKEA